MKSKKTNKEKKSERANSPFPHCGDFQKMAEMMKTFCTGERDGDCCAMMRKMMGQGKGAEAEKTKETQESEGGENG